jgi:phosphoglycerate dehydrogenase-like enzyme
MPRCAILDDYQGVARAMADWSPLDGRVALDFIGRHLTGSDLVDRIAPCEIVVAMRERTPFPASLLDRLPRLKLLVTSGMRNGAIDMEAARARGVTVCGTASSSTPPVELTWALITGLARHLAVETGALRSDGPWQSTVGTDLAGATLGLLGLGKIGQRVARIGRAFEMEVIAWSPNLDAERAAAAGARLVDKATLFGESDICSIHLVLAETTRDIVGRAELAAMKPTALLVNTSRAGLVEAGPLIETLQERRIAGYGVDVYDEEPLPSGHPFRSLANVLATPHLGYVTRGNYARYFAEAVEDIAGFLDGQPVRVLNG